MVRFQHMCNLFVDIARKPLHLQKARGADVLMLLGNIGHPSSFATFEFLRGCSMIWPQTVWIPGAYELKGRTSGEYHSALKRCADSVRNIKRVHVLNGSNNRGFHSIGGVKILGIPSAATKEMAEEDFERVTMELEGESNILLCSAETPDSLLRPGSSFVRSVGPCLTSAPGDTSIPREIKWWLSGHTTVCSGYLSQTYWSTNPLYNCAEDAQLGKVQKYFLSDRYHDFS